MRGAIKGHGPPGNLGVLSCLWRQRLYVWRFNWPKTGRKHPSPESNKPMQHYDVVILGAGAAGLMCAANAGQRGKSVLVVDHARKIGEKIRISGGGRCNFTNMNTKPAHFLSSNPRFCVSALKGYTPRDFLRLVDSYRIAYHEKDLGQLFCDESASQIVDMLLSECRKAGVQLETGMRVETCDRRAEGGFALATENDRFTCDKLVVATGGKSIPKIGASGYGYFLADHFGLNVLPTRPALVPLTFEGKQKEELAALSGVSVQAAVSIGKTKFIEALLFTHRGLSGPVILQISSFWQDGQSITIDLAHGASAFETLRAARQSNGKQEVQTVLATLLPKRLVAAILKDTGISGRVGDCSDKILRIIDQRVHAWTVMPAGTEGYRTAEVTGGGVDTSEISSKTMEARNVPGLYFIGEVLDVTGHLGGYNFQWAWSSAMACARAL